jgi:hypothetical protein
LVIRIDALPNARRRSSQVGSASADRLFDLRAPVTKRTGYSVPEQPDHSLQSQREGNGINPTGKKNRVNEVEPLNYEIPPPPPPSPPRKPFWPSKKEGMEFAVLFALLFAFMLVDDYLAAWPQWGQELLKAALLLGVLWATRVPFKPGRKDAMDAAVILAVLPSASPSPPTRSPRGRRGCKESGSVLAARRPLGEPHLLRR